MRSEQKKAKRKEAILQAFESLIARYSVDKTTMQEVASAAGISVGTLYNEYADKEALIDAMIVRLEDRYYAKINALQLESDSPEEQLFELLTAISNLIGEMAQNYRSLMDYFITGVQRFRHIGKKIHQSLEKDRRIQNKVELVIRAGVEKGVFEVENVTATAQALIEAHIHYSVQRVLMDRKEGRAVKKGWEMLLKLLIRGMRKR
ncbi:MAG: TetR/AcrR family transcriptional regulator [Candidatus Zixiibacteriota bacterium]